MKISKISLLKTSKEYFYFFLVFFTIFILNLSFEYLKYKEFKKNSVYENIYTITKIYPKKDSFILKLNNVNMNFYTKITKQDNLSLHDRLNLLVLTRNISFYSYLKGFYSNIIILEVLEKEKKLKYFLQEKIRKQHQNPNVSSIYESIFLAIPLNKKIRVQIASYGISHLFAISGFHLGVIVMILYFIFNVLYKSIHQRYVPFRNKRFDILILVMIMLFFYLFLIDFVASYLRSFIMFIFAFVLLRCNIKILSFKSLLFALILILSLFPKYIFSLSLWFSISGVFYIFLYIQYFKNMNKIFSILFFNVWIFFALNPIIHYFFPITSLYQLYSPFLSLLFILFYPLVLFLHLIGFSNILDDFVFKYLFLEIQTYEIKTSVYFFFLYLFVSFKSINNKNYFYFLNVLLIVFVLYIFV